MTSGAPDHSQLHPATNGLCGLDEEEAGRSLKSSKDFKDVKGVGKSTLEMLDEFIKTGTCSRLDEFRTKQVKLWTNAKNYKTS